MDNQHRRISGYRELSQAEIDLMNKIISSGVQLQSLVSFIDAYLAAQRAAPVQDEQERIDAAQPARWAAIAKTHFQEGLMALTRAVAQPGFF